MRISDWSSDVCSSDLGTDYDPPKFKTTFAYPEDLGNFAHATIRCVGVGECRRRGGGVMCPSYMATGEEMHSTRGRARLLFEMAKGEAIGEDRKSTRLNSSH